MDWPDICNPFKIIKLFLMLHWKDLWYLPKKISEKLIIKHGLLAKVKFWLKKVFKLILMLNKISFIPCMNNKISRIQFWKRAVDRGEKDDLGKLPFLSPSIRLHSHSHKHTLFSVYVYAFATIITCLEHIPIVSNKENTMASFHHYHYHINYNKNSTSHQ